ncbi:flippase activity-associated protein Agl23 [Oleiharenicola lentus]|uniref:flippase activity-associated protein Agl23 n=1 Tax=Oleiharenicola lentus TaxID=2508720 RepID=UPI003F673522
MPFFSSERAKSWGALALFGLVLAIGFAVRVHDLAVRPMHADEANQAVKLGELIEQGNYRFDPSDHHGPTLYYFARIVAWVAGENSLAALSEATVRLTPVLFGTLSIALLWLLVLSLGPRAASASALFFAVSPAAVYYSRYFVQETLLVTFLLGAWVCGAKWFRSGAWSWALALGACCGLMQATKASATLFIGLSLVAVLAAGRGGRLRELARDWRASGGALLAAASVWAAFYSSFGSNAGGLSDALGTFAPMWSKATAGASGHEKPWWYYGGLFGFQRNGGYVWDQSLFALLAVIGALLAWCRGPRLGRFAAVYVVSLAMVLSLAPYKTPWIVVNLVPGLCVLAGLALLQRGIFAWLVTGVVALALVWQMRQAVFLRPADQRNPFAYQHTSLDLLKITALARSAPAGTIKIISEEYWPLPWYLRARSDAGYWQTVPEDCDGALVIVSADFAEAVRARMKGRYRESFLGLRPGFVLIVFTQEPVTPR